MRIFLTGASGQIGRAIVGLLGNDRHAITGLSRRSNAVQGLAGNIVADLGMTGVLEQIADVVSPCEAIIHSAASLSHDLYDPTISLTNCLGTQHIVKLAEIWGSRQIVYLSSIPVIGRPQFDPITEDHPVNPLSAYHASKLFGEYLMKVANRDGCPAVSLRLPSPAGPGTPKNRILSVFVRRAKTNQPIQLLGQGTRSQNYVDVRDVAAAVEACLSNSASGLYNIAAATSITNRDLAKICIDEMSSSSPIAFAGKPDPEEGLRWNVSISKAHRDLGYHPRFDIRDSIRAISHEHSDPE